MQVDVCTGKTPKCEEKLSGKTTLCHAMLKPSEITAGSCLGAQNGCFCSLPIRQSLRRLYQISALIFLKRLHLALSDHFY